LELEEAGSLQPTVDSLQLKRESKEGLTAETLRALRTERREESRQSTLNSRQLKTKNKDAESDFNTEGTEVGDTEIAEKAGSDSEWEWGANIGESGEDPFGGLRGDILRWMFRVGGGIFEGGVELAVFGVVGEVEGFEEGVGEVVGGLADLLAAFGGEDDLGEVAEGGGAAGGDAVGGEGAEDAGHGAVNVVFGGGIIVEEPDLEQEVFVALVGRAAFEDGAVGAAVAVEGRDGGHAAAASIGEYKVAKVEG
jgi:hypothetical protein